jgi:ubiquinone/menaquinone biosynthesis C-methylase UbiE
VIRDYFNRIAAEWDETVPETPDLQLYLERFGIQSGERVLDMGSGTGRVSERLKEMVGGEGMIIPTDCAINMLRRAGSRLDPERVLPVCSEAEALPYRTSLFDKIVCFSAFPHFTDPDRTLREMFRILKPGGSLLILHACCSESLNAFHASLEGDVKEDVLPAIDEMEALMRRSQFNIVCMEEHESLYWAEGRKPAG